MSRPVVLVLAGGASNRFWPLRDKPLVELGSQTLLERHLRLLRAAGCERFIVVSRPETASQIEVIGAAVDLDPATGAGPLVRVAVQPEPRGMADAVLSARDLLLELGDEPVYVTQAQDIVEARLHAELLDRWEQTPGLDGLVAAQRVTGYFPGGYLTLEGGYVTSVIEKPGAGNEPSDLVNLVAHVFASARGLVDALEAESATPGPDDAYERALTRLMALGRFEGHVYDGRWQALKYPWQLLDVADMLLDQWASGAESPGRDYEQPEEGVFIGRDVKVFPGAYIVAPALIGNGSIIGHNSLVRGAIVGPRCVVGFGSEVARSVLFEGVELHHNYVGDSVFDREAAMGYGAVTANYRIDGRTCPSVVAGERIDSGRMKLGLMLGAQARIGVNSSTMPGVKIGANTMIGPNLKVTRDVPDGARVLDGEEYGRF
jgi:bifunctional UDP-N-acetylglucosamine pyrophosphorylase/glucosamine-1-phosphate N-acetyltransferase